MAFEKWKKAFKKPNKQAEKELREGIEREGGLEKGDMPAMMISAFLVIFPVAIGALFLLCLLGWLMFF